MKVLISWSGEKSKTVALALREWLPFVIQSIEPWMSGKDIDAGSRWNREIDEELSTTNFGIICVTKNNVEAPWINFEAGALAKSVNNSYVCPYLIDLETSQLPQGPLSQFMAMLSNEDDTLKLIETINKALGEQSVSPNVIKKSFKHWWPDLQKTLDTLPDNDILLPTKPPETMLPEILDLVRLISRKLMREESSTIIQPTTYFGKVPYDPTQVANQTFQYPSFTQTDLIQASTSTKKHSD